MHAPIAARRENVMQILLAEGVTADRVRYRDGTAEELAGQRGVSGYRFVYKMGNDYSTATIRCIANSPASIRST